MLNMIKFNQNNHKNPNSLEVLIHWPLLVWLVEWFWKLYILSMCIHWLIAQRAFYILYSNDISFQTEDNVKKYINNKKTEHQKTMVVRNLLNLFCNIPVPLFWTNKMW